MKHREMLTAMSKTLALAAVTMGLAVSSVCAAQAAASHTLKRDSGSDGSLPTGGVVFDAANGNWSDFGFVRVEATREKLTGVRRFRINHTIRHGWR